MPGKVSVPVRGVGCFRRAKAFGGLLASFRPREGCGLLHRGRRRPGRPGAHVSVPVRGVGCFRQTVTTLSDAKFVSVPVRGVGCFAIKYPSMDIDERFPSP